MAQVVVQTVVKVVTHFLVADIAGNERTCRNRDGPALRPLTFRGESVGAGLVDWVEKPLRRCSYLRQRGVPSVRVGESLALLFQFRVGGSLTEL